MSDSETNPFKLIIHDIVQLVFDYVEFHHGVGTEDGGGECETRVVCAPVLTPEFLRQHFRADALASQFGQFFGFGISTSSAVVVAIQVDILCRMTAQLIGAANGIGSDPRLEIRVEIGFRLTGADGIARQTVVVDLNERSDRHVPVRAADSSQTVSFQ